MTEVRETKRARVTASLRSRIESGEFDANGQLPPERVLASNDEYDVARETIRRVLEQLQTEQLVFRFSRGRGGCWKLGRPAADGSAGPRASRFEDLPRAAEYLQRRAAMLTRHERELNEISRRQMAESLRMTEEFRASLAPAPPGVDRFTVQP